MKDWKPGDKCIIGDKTATVTAEGVAQASAGVSPSEIRVRHFHVKFDDGSTTLASILAMREPPAAKTTN